MLWEFFISLSAPQHRTRAHGLAAALWGNPAIAMRDASPALFQAGLTLHGERPDKAWSLTDCVSFIVMREVDCAEALTHDLHFEQAGFKALLRYPPSE